MDVGAAIKHLKEAWANEKGAPELLAFKDELVEKVQEEIARQGSDLDQAKSEASLKEIDRLAISLYEVELERVKYILKSYIHTRLKKLQKMHFYLSEVPAARDRLSGGEKEFLDGYTALVRRHLNDAFLRTLPEGIEEVEFSIEEKRGFEPNLDNFVFLKALEDIGDYQIADDVIFDMKENDQILVKYKAIQKLLQENRATLI